MVLFTSLYIHFPNYTPHDKIAGIAENIKNMTGRAVHVFPDEKRPDSPGYARFSSDKAIITIGIKFLQAPYLDIIVSHEILHLYLKCYGFPIFHWHTEADDYYGSAIDSAIHHPYIISLQKESMKIDPYPFIMMDIKRHKRVAAELRYVGYKQVEEQCRTKSIIFLADRLNWNINHMADFKQAIRAYRAGYPDGYKKAIQIVRSIESFWEVRDYKKTEQCCLDICNILDIKLSYHVTFINQ